MRGVRCGCGLGVVSQATAAPAIAGPVGGLLSDHARWPFCFAALVIATPSHRLSCVCATDITHREGPHFPPASISLASTTQRLFPRERCLFVIFAPQLSNPLLDTRLSAHLARFDVYIFWIAWRDHPKRVTGHEIYHDLIVSHPAEGEAQRRFRAKSIRAHRVLRSGVPAWREVAWLVAPRICHIHNPVPATVVSDEILTNRLSWLILTLNIRSDSGNRIRQPVVGDGKVP